VYPFALINGSWLARGVINGPEPGPHRQFGVSVDFWGNTLVAGAPFAVTNGMECGAVYTYLTNADGSTWINGVKLVPWQLQDLMHFGWSVALENDKMVVGAWADDNDTLKTTGGAFIFTKANGIWTNTGGYSGTQPYGEAGRSVALDGDKAFISDENWNSLRGRVVVFNSISQFINCPDLNLPLQFGKCVAAHNGRYIAADDYGKVYFGVWE
jgi:hypothetical protein